jgi:hypothetical protein
LRARKLHIAKADGKYHHYESINSFYVSYYKTGKPGLFIHRRVAD